MRSRAEKMGAIAEPGLADGFFACAAFRSVAHDHQMDGVERTREVLEGGDQRVESVPRFERSREPDDEGVFGFPKSGFEPRAKTLAINTVGKRRHRRGAGFSPQAFREVI